MFTWGFTSSLFGVEHSDSYIIDLISLLLDLLKYTLQKFTEKEHGREIFWEFSYLKMSFFFIFLYLLVRYIIIFANFYQPETWRDGFIIFQHPGIIIEKYSAIFILCLSFLKVYITGKFTFYNEQDYCFWQIHRIVYSTTTMMQKVWYFYLLNETYISLDILPPWWYKIVWYFCLLNRIFIFLGNFFRLLSLFLILGWVSSHSLCKWWKLKTSELRKFFLNYLINYFVLSVLAFRNRMLATWSDSLLFFCFLFFLCIFILVLKFTWPCIEISVEFLKQGKIN
jgi:hypothetical protein